MSRHTRARRLVAALALATTGLVAVACGDDDGPVTTEGEDQMTEESDDEMTDDSMADDDMSEEPSS